VVTSLTFNARNIARHTGITRVPQPPGTTSSAGKPAGPVSRGGVSLVTFFGRTKKVTSRRATPGEVEIDSFNKKGANFRPRLSLNQLALKPT